ncbi:MAG: hypothetical protein HY881_04325 [Deltaproteobacteria bacterium]|nr:hypothetical protein [Deltaproteobacteria bacterium]
MSHHHDHDHCHDHDHDDHHHHHEVQSEMSFEEKMVKLLDHWIRHNDDHAGTYRGWAEKAGENHLDVVADLLNEAARMTIAINSRFEAALAALTPQEPS